MAGLVLHSMLSTAAAATAAAAVALTIPVAAASVIGVAGGSRGPMINRASNVFRRVDSAVSFRALTAVRVCVVPYPAPVRSLLEQVSRGE